MSPALRLGIIFAKRSTRYFVVNKTRQGSSQVIDDWKGLNYNEAYVLLRREEYSLVCIYFYSTVLIVDWREYSRIGTQFTPLCLSRCPRSRSAPAANGEAADRLQTARDERCEESVRGGIACSSLKPRSNEIEPPIAR